MQTSNSMPPELQILKMFQEKEEQRQRRRQQQRLQAERIDELETWDRIGSLRISEDEENRSPRNSRYYPAPLEENTLEGFIVVCGGTTKNGHDAAPKPSLRNNKTEASKTPNKKAAPFQQQLTVSTATPAATGTLGCLFAAASVMTSSAVAACENHAKGLVARYMAEREEEEAQDEAATAERTKNQTPCNVRSLSTVQRSTGEGGRGMTTPNHNVVAYSQSNGTMDDHTQLVVDDGNVYHNHENDVEMFLYEQEVRQAKQHHRGRTMGMRRERNGRFPVDTMDQEVIYHHVPCATVDVPMISSLVSPTSKKKYGFGTPTTVPGSCLNQDQSFSDLDNDSVGRRRLHPIKAAITTHNRLRYWMLVASCCLLLVAAVVIGLSFLLVKGKDKASPSSSSSESSNTNDINRQDAISLPPSSEEPVPAPVPTIPPVSTTDATTPNGTPPKAVIVSSGNNTTSEPVVALDTTASTNTTTSAATVTAAPTSTPAAVPTAAPTAVPTDTPTSTPTVPPTTTRAPLDVLIIGAGWSGLAALDTLLKQQTASGEAPLNVQLLEARDRIGGRCHTMRDFVPDLPVELGSEWVVPGTSVQSQVETMKLNYSITKWDYDTVALYKTRALHGQAAAAQLTKYGTMNLLYRVWNGDTGFVLFAQEQVQYLREIYSDTSVDNVVKDYLKKSKNIFSNKDSLAYNDETQFLNTMTHAEIGTVFAANIRDMSAKEVLPLLLQHSDMSYVGVPGGGYDNLLTMMAEPWINHIQLQSQVTAVQYGEDAQLARVTYIDANGVTRNVEAAAVLVTVPLGVLKTSSVEFVPVLPQEKLDAIRSLGYGNLNKCIMYWQDAEQAGTWWPRDKEAWLGLITDTHETAEVWTLFFNPVTQGNGDNNHMLVGWIAGDAADSMERQSDEQVLSSVLSNLRTMLGSAVPNPTKFQITRWSQDEFSRGAYSYPKPGEYESSRYREDLQRPVGNLFWAGEATDPGGYATTSGAYNSGVKAANDILERLNYIV